MLVTRGLGGRTGLVAFGFGYKLVIRWPSVEPGTYAVAVGSSPLALVMGEGPLASCGGPTETTTDLTGSHCAVSAGETACATDESPGRYSVSS